MLRTAGRIRRGAVVALGTTALVVGAGLSPAVAEDQLPLGLFLDPAKQQYDVEKDPAGKVFLDSLNAIYPGPEDMDYYFTPQERLLGLAGLNDWPGGPFGSFGTPGGPFGDIGEALRPPQQGQGVMRYVAKVRTNQNSKRLQIDQVSFDTAPVDRDGVALPDAQRPSLTVEPAAATTGKSARVDCNWSGSRRGVKVPAAGRQSFDTSIGTLDLTTMLAQAPGAGAKLGQPGTSQWAGCVASGVKLKKGYRIIESGGAIAYPDADHTHKVGSVWEMGKSSATYDSGATFPAGVKTTAGLLGAVRQEAGGNLRGSFAAPSANPVDIYARNAAWGWWQDPCADEEACPGDAGSRGFHGATANAAWVLPGNGPQTFLVTGFVRYACADAQYDAFCRA